MRYDARRLPISLRRNVYVGPGSAAFGGFLEAMRAGAAGDEYADGDESDGVLLQLVELSEARAADGESEGRALGATLGCALGEAVGPRDGATCATPGLTSSAASRHRDSPPSVLRRQSGHSPSPYAPRC